MTSTHIRRRTTSRASRRITSPTSRRTITRAAAGGAVLTLALLAGCEPDDRDDRPASDYATLVDELRALPGVDGVEGTPGTQGTERTFTVVLDPDSGEAELRTVGKRSHTLVNDHRYPSGAPEVTVEYGPFTTEAQQSRPGGEYVVCADACGQPWNESAS